MYDILQKGFHLLGDCVYYFRVRTTASEAILGLAYAEIATKWQHFFQYRFNSEQDLKLKKEASTKALIQFSIFTKCG